MFPITKDTRDVLIGATQLESTIFVMKIMISDLSLGLNDVTSRRCRRLPDLSRAVMVSYIRNKERGKR